MFINTIISFPVPRLEFTLIVKPSGETSIDDGIIFYLAENKDGSGDYIAISIVNGYIQLLGKLLSSRLR